MHDITLKPTDDGCVQREGAGCASKYGWQEFMLWWLPGMQVLVGLL